MLETHRLILFVLNQRLVRDGVNFAHVDVCESAHVQFAWKQNIRQHWRVTESEKKNSFDQVILLEKTHVKYLLV